MLQAAVKEADVKMIDKEVVSKPEPEVYRAGHLFPSSWNYLPFSWAGWCEVTIAEDARNGSSAKTLNSNTAPRPRSRWSSTRPSSASRSPSDRTFSEFPRPPGPCCQQPGLGASSRCRKLWSAGWPPETKGGEGGDQGFCFLRNKTLKFKELFAL